MKTLQLARNRKGFGDQTLAQRDMQEPVLISIRCTEINTDKAVGSVGDEKRQCQVQLDLVIAQSTDRLSKMLRRTEIDTFHISHVLDEVRDGEWARADHAASPRNGGSKLFLIGGD